MGRLRIFLFFTYPKSKASRRLSLVQFGERRTKGASIRGSAKRDIWARISSWLASLHLPGNPANGKKNEGKTPTPQLDHLWQTYLIYFLQLSNGDIPPPPLPAP